MSSSASNSYRGTDYLLGIGILLFVGLILVWTGRYLQPSHLPPASPGSYHYITRLESIAPGTAMAFELEGRHWLLARMGEDITSVSASCTYRGSRIRWDPDSRLFVCESHGCVFGPRGNPIHGLATSPLEALTIRIIEGRIYGARGRV